MESFHTTMEFVEGALPVLGMIKHAGGVAFSSGTGVAALSYMGIFANALGVCAMALPIPGAALLGCVPLALSGALRVICKQEDPHAPV